MIREKVKAFLLIPSLIKKEFISLENIEKSIKNRKDLFKRVNGDLYLEKNFHFFPKLCLITLKNMRNLSSFS